MSLNEWPLLGEPTFTGADNYTAIADDELFTSAIWFTVKYTVITTVVLFVIAFGMALLVQHSRPGVGLMRTAYFLPAAVGLAAASLLWFALYSNDVGPLSDVLIWLGVVDQPVQWLDTPDSALWSTVAMVTWRFAGFQMLILMTGLQAIPVDVYEAARIDGAGWWRTMRSITLPLMRPTIALLLVLSVTGSLLAFEQFYLLTGGGPDNSTVTVVMVLYRQAFRLLDLGVAAAMSVVVLIALIAGNVLQLSIVRKGGE
ncbi:ABC transporter permease [Kibdelosporangium aridum]|uniref:ABC transporter permease n=2 Tax=Kibdelosporangium aridum TaxID=2030 RepID=A0A428ZIY5_KIBAR|nr:ABC transporter permease [Kibdelosporangium aridum]